MPSANTILGKMVVSKSIYRMGLLEIDSDPAATRCAVLARDTLAVIWYGKPLANHPVRLFVEPRHAAAGVICAIIDDTGTYNIKAADGVKCALVDANRIAL